MCDLFGNRWTKCIVCNKKIDTYIGGYARDWYYIYCIKCFREEYFNE